MIRFIIGFLSLFGFSNLGAAADKWVEVEIGIIGAASEDILSSAFAQAEELGAKGVLITLDTPGGALDATRKMVKSIMSQRIPVVVWVGPSGAHAGSAGAFITLSAHVAAMAEGTNIGAAHPIQASGKDIEDDAKAKIENDTAAFMESIAEARQRNKEMAVSFVVNSLSVTAAEALENKVIDLVANDRKSLMDSIQGREVTLDGGGTIKLQTSNVEFVPYENTTKQAFLQIISNPNLFYLLFVAGVLGIGFEITHPGSLFPGVFGAISLILALIATSVLPVNFGAVVLILASIAFIVGEAFLPSFGVLGIGGVVGFVAGSILLVDPRNEEGLRISLMTILPTSVVFLLALAGILWLVVKSDRSKVVSGSEAMIGGIAEVISGFGDGVDGRVRYEGEDWSATLLGGAELKPGAKVVISKRDGLKLFVRGDKDGVG